MSRTVVAVVCLVLACGALAASMSLEDQWTSFKLKHGKKYATDLEDRRRFAIFANHVEFIEKHNAEFEQGLHTYTTALNEYCDLSTEEFVAMVNGLRYDHATAKQSNIADLSAVGDLPTSIDWRTKGVVTPVKNQGQCGDCWAFSATGSTEGAHALATGSLVSLSEQNLNDCSTAEGNQGCNGGLMDDAFKYIIKNNGVDTEASYPYTATGPNRCKFNPANVGATLSSYKDVQSGSESALQQAVGTVGPVSVGIDASHQSFQVYSSGVYYEPACSSTQLDHGVLCVGYGVDGGSDFWLVKNSWGTTWGMAGYIEMSRNRNNNCGIATSASYPIAGGSSTGSGSGSGSGSTGSSSGSGSFFA